MAQPHALPLTDAESDALYFAERKAALNELVRSMPAVDTLADLLARPVNPPAYLVDGALARGEIVNLSGPYKLGKTWFALDLALAVSDDTRADFLGFSVPLHGPVLYVNAENPVDVLHERLAWLGGRSDNHNLHLCSTFGQLMLDNDDDVAALQAWVALNRPALVVFDSLVRFHSWEENSSTAMANVFRAVEPLAREHDAAVLFLDHPSRDGKGGPRGSGDKQAQVDRIWELQGEPGSNTWTWKTSATRRGLPPQPLRVSLECDGATARLRVDGAGGGHSDALRSLLAYLLDRTPHHDFYSSLRDGLYGGKDQPLKNARAEGKRAGLLKEHDGERGRTFIGLTDEGVSAATKLG